MSTSDKTKHATAHEPRSASDPHKPAPHAEPARRQPGEPVQPVYHPEPERPAVHDSPSPTAPAPTSEPGHQGGHMTPAEHEAVQNAYAHR